MMNHFRFKFVSLVFVFIAGLTVHTQANAAAPVSKEWTMLLFLNGHNNLDSFGHMNMKQMQSVGSTNDVNLVVQWASLKNKNTKRVYVKKGSYDVIQDMKPVDMGDYQQLIEFVRWGVANYPAKKYFIAVWNHGNGWHIMNNEIRPTDISYDDLSGNQITTEQLGLAMTESAKIIGHKVDMYGSDACLMSMFEVAGEMADSVSTFVGSQEVEPGEGWPYDTFLKAWTAQPTMSSNDLGILLSKEYLKAYSAGGSYSTQDVVFSALDLTKLPGVYTALSSYKNDLVIAVQKDPNAIRGLAGSTQDFTYTDYKDMLHFSKLVASSSLVMPAKQADLENAMKSLVISNDVSSNYRNATGISVWLPTSQWTYDTYKDRYNQLQFNKATGWGEFLKLLAD